MNQPILYAMVAMVCYGLSDFIYKQAAAATIRADHFLMAQGWFFCPFVILYAFATGTLIPDPAALWGSLAGVFIFIELYYVHAARDRCGLFRRPQSSAAAGDI